MTTKPRGYTNWNSILRLNWTSPTITRARLCSMLSRRLTHRTSSSSSNSSINCIRRSRRSRAAVMSTRRRIARLKNSNSHLRTAMASPNRRCRWRSWTTCFTNWPPTRMAALLPSTERATHPARASSTWRPSHSFLPRNPNTLFWASAQCSIRRRRKTREQPSKSISRFQRGPN